MHVPTRERDEMQFANFQMKYNFQYGRLVIWFVLIKYPQKDEFNVIKN